MGSLRQMRGLFSRRMLLLRPSVREWKSPVNRNFGFLVNHVKVSSQVVGNPKPQCRFYAMATSDVQYENDQPNVIAADEARRFMVDCLVAAGAAPQAAKDQADLLLEADLRGHFSHGMNRLEMYCNDLLKNATNGHGKPVVIKEKGATAWVDGKNCLGAVVGNFAMGIAIEKAKEFGVGWVVAKGSNHYGIAAWYPLQAMKHGFIGISMTNTSPLVCPTRSKEAALGTNPLCVAAPASTEDKNFILDMATSAVAVGKIEIQCRKKQPLPSGWAQGPDGNETHDAKLAFDTGCLLPLGGSEISSGYKGYGLGAMVDMFCGVMAGSLFSTKVRKWTHAGSNTEADLGQMFVAIDPECFAPGFQGRLDEFVDILRGCEATNPEKPVLVAGDPERMHIAKVQKEGGIRYHPNQIQTCTSLAQRLKIKPIEFNN